MESLCKTVYRRSYFQWSGIMLKDQTIALYEEEKTGWNANVTLCLSFDLGAQVSRNLDVQVSRCPCTHVPRCPWAQVSRCPGIQVLRCPGAQVLRCPGVPAISQGLQRLYPSQSMGGEETAVCFCAQGTFKERRKTKKTRTVCRYCICFSGRVANSLLTSFLVYARFWLQHWKHKLLPPIRGLDCWKIAFIAKVTMGLVSPSGVLASGGGEGASWRPWAASSSCPHVSFPSSPA